MSTSAQFGSRRQRHGVAKARVELIGGALVGAALVLLARSMLAAREREIVTGGVAKETANVRD